MQTRTTSDRITNALARYRVHNARFAAIAARRDTKEGPPGEPPPVPAELSRRELDVLRLAADGYTADEAAAELMLTDHTVKSHFKRILVKLGARNRTHAVTLALRRGLIS